MEGSGLLRRAGFQAVFGDFGGFWWWWSIRQLSEHSARTQTRGVYRPGT